MYKSFKNQQVLKEIILRIREGETMVLIDPSGSLKIPMLKLTNELLIPDDGKIFINGINTKSKKSLKEYFNVVNC